jgi:hypothetical protein
MTRIADDKHFHADIKGGMGDEIQFVIHERGTLNVEIEEPWAGSTATGFGATASVTMSREQAIALRDWLNKVIPT